MSHFSKAFGWLSTYKQHRIACVEEGDAGGGWGGVVVLVFGMSQFSKVFIGLNTFKQHRIGCHMWRVEMVGGGRVVVVVVLAF